ncbi:transporter substrate-binding protein [Streptomyces albidoflavus]|uniref:transporter substrate-binding protein n=1 Tax=Streptomyces albidoflavus TaxID=1886 RepID=UPI00068545E7
MAAVRGGDDGASGWPTSAEKARRLIREDQVAATFGCWTSASRKAVKPVFEKNRSLLFHPVQYAGLEQSPYIFCSGATTNQQIVPGPAATTSSRAPPTRSPRRTRRPTA